VESKRGRIRRVKYWEIIGDNLKKAGWSLGWVSALDLEGRTIWIADAHRGGKRFIVRPDEKLTALVAAARSTGAAAGWVVISALHAPWASALAWVSK
jgi:hypothetical protein